MSLIEQILAPQLKRSLALFTFWISLSLSVSWVLNSD